jgi:hypothetical protein
MLPVHRMAPGAVVRPDSVCKLRLREIAGSLSCFFAALPSGYGLHGSITSLAAFPITVTIFTAVSRRAPPYTQPSGGGVGMRVFIHNITHRWKEGKPELYDFALSAEAALFWPTGEQAEEWRFFMEQFPIAINPPYGQRVCCEDYRVEERPHGGFCISCSYPFATASV